MREAERTSDLHDAERRDVGELRVDHFLHADLLRVVAAHDSIRIRFDSQTNMSMHERRILGSATH